MEEEKLKNFNCKTDYDTCFSYVLFFNGKTGPKKEKLTPNEQNNVIRKKLIDTAHRIGYSPTVMSGIRDIINSIDFATQPSLLNYQKKSAGDLQKKLWYTKSRINHYLANERVESKHNLKTAEAQEAAPFNFVSNSCKGLYFNRRQRLSRHTRLNC